MVQNVRGIDTELDDLLVLLIRNPVLTVSLILGERTSASGLVACERNFPESQIGMTCAEGPVKRQHRYAISARARLDS